LKNPTVGLFWQHGCHSSRLRIQVRHLHGRSRTSTYPHHRIGAGEVNLSGPDGKPETVYFIGIKQSDQRRLMADVIKRRDEFLQEWERIHGQSN
jgi:hypothetical protein